MKYSIGDVVQLKYGTLKSNEGKYIINTHHMFVILDIKNNTYIASPASSQNGKLNPFKYPNNVQLKDALAAGFSKPNTHVKVDRYSYLEDKHIYKHIGKLTSKDLKRLIYEQSSCADAKILEQLNIFEFMKNIK